MCNCTKYTTVYLWDCAAAQVITSYRQLQQCGQTSELLLSLKPLLETVPVRERHALLLVLCRGLLPHCITNSNSDSSADSALSLSEAYAAVVWSECSSRVSHAETRYGASLKRYYILCVYIYIYMFVC
jgi:hypothetical protein